MTAAPGADELRIRRYLLDLGLGIRSGEPERADRPADHSAPVTADDHRLLTGIIQPRQLRREGRPTDSGPGHSHTTTEGLGSDDGHRPPYDRGRER